MFWHKILDSNIIISIISNYYYYRYHSLFRLNYIYLYVLVNYVLFTIYAALYGMHMEWHGILDSMGSHYITSFNEMGLPLRLQVSF